MTTTTIDHAKCPPEAHDRSLPDEPFEDEQAKAEDGLMGCNDCGLPLFYCRKAEWYFHVDPDAECFLSAAWGTK